MSAYATVKRIFVEKNDTAAKIVERVLNDPEQKLVLVIPNNAAFKKSPDNFAVLSREAAAAKKKLIIESVDEDILSLAKRFKLGASHPLFASEKGVRSFSDIVTADTAPKSAHARRSRVQEPPVMADKGEENESDEDSVEESADDADAADGERERQVRRDPSPIETLDLHYEDDRMSWAWRAVWFVAIVFVAAGGIWLVDRFFGRATLVINFKATPWQYQNALIASKSTLKIDPEAGLLPAEVFRENRNLTKLFPASGKSSVSERAKGKLTIYNAFSSAPQVLVATTRFATPDGKIYRLDAQVAVPGAQIRDGKITRASIVANATADAPGDAYNVGPVEKLAIPGFKGSPKYDKFYGSLSEGASGGSSGERAVATEQDIANAKQKMTDILKSSLNANLLSTYARDFKIIDGTTEVVITKLNANRMADANGNFSVFGEAEARAIGFKETDLKDMLFSLASKDRPELRFKDLKVDYAEPKVNYDKGEMSFAITAQGTLTQSFSSTDFKEKILGKGVREVRSLVASIAGITDGKISLWPLWLQKVPSDPKRVNLLIQ